MIAKNIEQIHLFFFFFDTVDKIFCSSVYAEKIGLNWKKISNLCLFIENDAQMIFKIIKPGMGVNKTNLVPEGIRSCGEFIQGDEERNA